MSNITNLSNSIQNIKGIGEQRAKLFNKLNIFTVEDIIHHYPRDYEDRTTLSKISELKDDTYSTFVGVIMSKIKETKTKGGLTILSLQVKDETGSITLTWFNQAYLKYVFKINYRYYFFGKINTSPRLVAQSPDFLELTSPNKEDFLKILPNYPSTIKLTQNIIRTTIKKVFEDKNTIILNTLPEEILKKYNLLETSKALYNIHFPTTLNDISIARKTLVFEELLRLQLSLLNVKNSTHSKKEGIQFSKLDTEISKFIDNMPFKLTNAQHNSFIEIKNDMESKYTMNRLLQGDVGSGKTIIAVLSLFKAVLSGYQGTIMVPTEILAKQHFESIKSLLLGYDISIELLVGSQTKKTKDGIKERLALGKIDILIGTHALIQKDVEFYNLGLVITDEQHRFGVRQRSLLSKKGINPDILVMSATPIPRTLALILYGDLDISIINELPPGRIPIETYVVDESKRDRINKFIEKHVNEGSQVYVVCPLIEESEKLDLNSANESYKNLVNANLQNTKVDILHGKMKESEKSKIMANFQEKRTDVLVSTTVIEVGVNIPNANIMIIENAERFGLLQLHQLRGRVGRGHKKSYCILFNQSNKDYVKKRLSVLEESTDGFVISEKDLSLRGPGDFFGTKQHGLPELKIANLYEDIEILKKAQEAANYIFSKSELLTAFNMVELKDIEL